MYDVTGIQDFVFASGKIKENVGASIIVQKVFEEYLNEVIEKACINNCRTEWNQYSDFQICSEPELQAEVLYMGGGNAMVAYQNRETAINVTKKLSYEILERTGGTLKFAVVYQNTECKDYLNDRDELLKKLKINKYRMVHQTPLLGIGITRQGDTDGLPAMIPVKEDNTQKYLSKSAYFKRKTWEKEKKYFDRLLPNTTDYDFPLEFDDLGQKKGENHIAVVHIDGNNMGKMLNQLLESDRTAEYQQSIQTVREFSKQVDKKYFSAMKCIVQELADGLKTDKLFYKKLDPVVKEKKLLLPIRPIVRSGDDVTFVCNGKIGIALAEEFLTELDHHTILLNDSETKLSACAGVAIVKSHFPFYRAYQLAEELCKSAKMKGNILAKMENVEEIGNWLDFHIVQTGISTNLNEIRDKFCQVPGMEPPKELKYPEYADMPEMRYKQYNLLWRPWCVAGNCDEKYQWNAFKAVYNEFEKEWKRSRLKKLESEMTRSANDAEIYIQECKSRGIKKLPECVRSSDLYRGGQTPYFDALELLDFYVTLPKAEEISHEN